MPEQVIEAKSRSEQLDVFYEYNEEKLPSKVEYIGLNGEQRTFEYEYDAFGNLTKETINGSVVHQYKDFSALGNAKTYIDPRGNTWKYTFDAFDNVLTETDPLDRVTTYEYDKVSNLSKIIQPNLAYETYTYNARNQIKTITDSYDKIRQYRHNVQGEVTEFTDEQGKVRGTVFDRQGRPQYRFDGNQLQTKFFTGKDPETGEGAFDTLNKVEYPTYSQLYKYDDRKQISQLTILESSRSNTYNYQYDPLGQVISATDPNGHSTYYSYDARGNVTEEDTSGLVSKYKYNAFGDLIEFTDRNNFVTTLEYDNFGRIIKKSRAGFGDWQYGYDKDDNLISQISPEGNEIVYVYDEANQLKEELWYTGIKTNGDDSLTPSKVVTYEYDANEQLISWSSGTLSGSFEWDKNGFLSTETVNYGSFSKTYQYQYYDNGTIKKFVMPQGTEYSYEYDNNDQLLRLKIPGEGSLRVNEYRWQAPARETLPGGIERITSYTDLLNTEEMQVSSAEGAPLLVLGYDYGTTQEITERRQDGLVTNYQYDEIYRLEQAVTTDENGESRTETYELDANSNRIGSHTTSNWQYNEAGQLVSRGEGLTLVSYKYDKNGNQVVRSDINSRLSFIYDQQDRLVRVENEKQEVIAAYEYDPFARRLSKTVAGQTTYFLYANEGVIAEYNSQGQELAHYGYKPDAEWGTSPVFLYTSSKDTSVTGKKYYYFHNDQIGTPFKLTDSSGFVAWDVRFDAFGNALLSNQNSIENPLRFPGQYFDAETGLHYNWRRYYDPEIGRYITADPIDLAGGPNLYTYVDGNPISRIDPNGECGIFGVFAGILLEVGTSIVTGDCPSYTLTDAIGDAFCGIGKFAKLAKLASRCKKNSFTGDTPVHTESGLVAIKDVKVGDKVRAYTEWNGKEQYELVEDIITNTKEYLLLKLTLDSGEVIETTSQHPFYILGKGWVEAEDLQLGDPLYRGDRAGTLSITNIDSQTRVETVYNLSVVNANTYFVGQDKVLVHNAKKGCPYFNKKNRPCYGANQVENVWNNQSKKRADGRVFDPNNGVELTWDRTKSRGGKKPQWDMGHKPGKDYASLHYSYIKGEISKEEFLSQYRDPDNYHPEDPSSNRSRKHDKPRKKCK
nr:RHS repeat-associated core domain-containing protein [Parashewanella hymeniacidonis]